VITVAPGSVATGVWTDPDGSTGRLAKQNGVGHQAFADQLLSATGATRVAEHITGAEYLIEGGIGSSRTSDPARTVPGSCPSRGPKEEM
jgi:hypothetical protein